MLVGWKQSKEARATQGNNQGNKARRQELRVVGIPTTGRICQPLPFYGLLGSVVACVDEAVGA